MFYGLGLAVEIATVQWAIVKSGHKHVAGAALGMLGGGENTPICS